MLADCLNSRYGSVWEDSRTRAAQTASTQRGPWTQVAAVLILLQFFCIFHTNIILFQLNVTPLTSFELLLKASGLHEVL